MPGEYKRGQWPYASDLNKLLDIDNVLRTKITGQAPIFVSGNAGGVRISLKDQPGFPAVVLSQSSGGNYSFAELLPSASDAWVIKPGGTSGTSLYEWNGVAATTPLYAFVRAGYQTSAGVQEYYFSATSGGVGFGQANQLLATNAAGTANVWAGAVTRQATSAFSVGAGDNRKEFLVDATSGAVTVSLPTSAASGSFFLTSFKKVDSTSAAVTLQPTGQGTVDGQSTYAMTQPQAAATLVADGLGNWDVVRSHPGQATSAGLSLVSTGANKAPTWQTSSGGGTSGITLLNNAGGTVDSACAFLKADAQGVISFNNTSTNHDQLVVAVATSAVSGIVNTSPQNWLGSKTFNSPMYIQPRTVSVSPEIWFVSADAVTGNLVMNTNNSGDGGNLSIGSDKDAAGTASLTAYIARFDLGTSAAAFDLRYVGTAPYTPCFSVGGHLGLTQSINYQKPGGTSGVITVTGGIITGVT